LISQRGISFRRLTRASSRQPKTSRSPSRSRSGWKSGGSPPTGRPAAYFCGIARLAVTFISEAFGVKSKKIKMRVGKKKEKVGYNFTSFAAISDATWMDDELVWEGRLARSGDYADITIKE
jgi:hypothetical protein